MLNWCSADIGAWRYVFEAMSYASAITNLTIVVFTNNSDILGYDLSDNGRLIFFIVSEHIVLLIKYTISTYIPDETFNTSLQLARQREYFLLYRVTLLKDLTIAIVLQSTWSQNTCTTSRIS
jgi:hypothetical protein